MFSSCSPIPQGTPDMLILRTLLLQPAHGYGIAQRIVEMSRETIRVSQGSLYPALHFCEKS
jgi:PadR family transcriptional regulator PadR